MCTPYLHSSSVPQKPSAEQQEFQQTFNLESDAPIPQRGESHVPKLDWHPAWQSDALLVQNPSLLQHFPSAHVEPVGLYVGLAGSKSIVCQPQFGDWARVAVEKTVLVIAT